MMEKRFLLIVLVILLLSGSACNQAIVPDNVLEGLHKPVINSIRPTAIRVNGAGFYLRVGLTTEDAQYVLYINDRKVGQVNQGKQPGYWQDSVGWMISKELIGELFASSPNGGAFSVRVTGISENYDVSDDFDAYRDYVSEPVTVEIGKGETQFSEAKQLFPEWTYSSEPVIRCDPQGNIYLAWQEKLNGVYQTFFSFSADSGETWSQVQNISRSNESVGCIDLAADGAGHIYMTWEEKSDVFFCRSLDSGASWYFPVRLDEDGEYASLPSLVVDDHGDVFLAWHRSNGQYFGPTVRLAVSRDLGQTWNSRNFDVPWGMDYWRPLLAAQAGGRVHLFKGRSSTTRLFFDLFYSQDYGNNWQVQEVEVGDDNMYVECPLLRLGTGSQAYIVWGAYLQGRPPSGGLYFLRRGSSGDWAVIQNLDKMFPISDFSTALAVSRESFDLVLTWEGGLFVLRSKDEGRSWPVPEIVPGSDGYRISGLQDMALHPSGKIFLVFVRTLNVTGCGLYLTKFE